ncbi:hypothetical protein [Xanthobacter autotrophicus]|uniref:hypothetical protein n=1 Tax=Xanthobacter autotrophicus TaxID=280 RepID=UPI0024A760F1|nr:hypothetical protein [Xanthobacter autotrophicus]MDI4655101.1 hypothetical protein [Xanthobacter autotrophicus]
MAAHKHTLPRQSAPKAAKPGRAPVSRGPAPAAPPPDYDFPAAGPHARPHLMDPERTPGTGALSEPGRSRDGDATG